MLSSHSLKSKLCNRDYQAPTDHLQDIWQFYCTILDKH
jgi:hypothetical protein